jgi:hypothetical protein
MERELLHHFLRSGPARKFDVGRVTRKARRAEEDADNLLFRSPYCNSCILFKCVNLDENCMANRENAIDMLVYFPYDQHNPGDGGESLLFTERYFWQYFTTKLRRADCDLPSLQADFATLQVFDSIPTFSPIILELAFERRGLAIPKSYLDLPPDLRSKLRLHIKERIRPLAVAASHSTGADTEKAVEDLSSKMFSLRSIDDIAPLLHALRIPEEEGITLLSAWIGITYFEHEYALIQGKVKAFAEWLNAFSMPREAIRPAEERAIEDLVREIKNKIRADWATVSGVWKEYVSSYEAYILHDNTEVFSAFLRKCNVHYWTMAHILGRLEQTIISWQHFTRNYFNVAMPYYRLMELYAVLRRLHLSDERAQFLSSASIEDFAI